MGRHIDSDMQSCQSYQDNRRVLPRVVFTLLTAPLLLVAAERPAPLGRLVDVGGYRVHLYCTGSGGPTAMVVGAGFSFDWGLVQGEAAKFTTICTYDVSGTAWSDAGPALTCGERVNEVHKLAKAAHLEGPLVLVGLSIGGCVARLYASAYPGEVAGMVIVDHAFMPDANPDAGKPRAGAGFDTAPVLIYQTPIVVTVEDASEFGKLPERIQELHRWAMGLNPKLPNWETAEECLGLLKAAAPGAYSLGSMPLVVVSTNNQARGYDGLQKELLALSHGSSQMVAERSFHAVEIDQPEVVVAAIRRVVASARQSGGK